MGLMGCPAALSPPTGATITTHGLSVPRAGAVSLPWEFQALGFSNAKPLRMASL
jgi:hypothetical protein